MNHQPWYLSAFHVEAAFFINFFFCLHMGIFIAVCGHVMTTLLCAAPHGFDSDTRRRKVG